MNVYITDNFQIGKIEDDAKNIVQGNHLVNTINIYFDKKVNDYFVGINFRRSDGVELGTYRCLKNNIDEKIYSFTLRDSITSVSGKLEFAIVLVKENKRIYTFKGVMNVAKSLVIKKENFLLFDELLIIDNRIKDIENNLNKVKEYKREFTIEDFIEGKLVIHQYEHNLKKCYINAIYRKNSNNDLENIIVDYICKENNNIEIITDSPFNGLLILKRSEV